MGALAALPLASVATTAAASISSSYFKISRSRTTPAFIASAPLAALPSIKSLSRSITRPFKS